VKTILYQQIVEAVSQLCTDANYYLGDDVVQALTKASEEEVSQTGRDVLQQILENAEIARTEQVPLCQDTGVAVFFIDLGQDVQIDGGYLVEAINQGVVKGYGEGYLRKSMVGDPLERKNTGDNTPAIIHWRIVPGDQLTITLAPKGGGSENMSAIKMMAPAAGIEGVKNFILDTVRQAGPNPCPPVVVGVGIGGNFEKSAELAKEALLRPLGEPNPDPKLDQLEKELLIKINKLGIGPQGFGGKTTALDVHILKHPCHIASLPVAVNINCHSHRHKSITL